RIAPEGALAPVLVGYVIAGVGIVSTAVTTTIAGTAGIGPHRQGLASGLLTMSQQVGGGIGASIASVMLAAAVTNDAGGMQVGLTAGSQAVLFVALALALMAAVLASRLPVSAPRGAHQGTAVATRTRMTGSEFGVT